jgi:hypothetical protein
MDITSTIQAKEEQQWVDQLFDGTWSEGGFPLRGIPKRANRDDWLYVIHRGKIVGRCRIKEVEEYDDVTIEEVGTPQHGERIKTKCSIHVQCTGERAPYQIPRKGHMGDSLYF